MTLPPRRELPDDVRERMRAAVRHGMASEPRHHHGRTMLGAAAVVIALAVGGVVVAQHARHDQAPAAPAGFQLDVATAEVQLDRCWATLEASESTSGYPDRASWRPVFQKASDPASEDSDYGVRVVAARAGDQVIFCETTSTTATVSPPRSLDTPSSTWSFPAAVTFFSTNGTVAGVTGAETSSLRVTGRDSDGRSFGADVSVGDRMFVVLTPSKPINTELSVEGTIGPLLPGQERMMTGVSQVRYPVATPRGAIGRVDRPVIPPPDRATSAGRFFGRCLENSSPLFDAASYAPAARLTEGDLGVVLGQVRGRVVACAVRPSNDPVLPDYRVTLLPHVPSPSRIQVQELTGIAFSRVSGTISVLVGSVPFRSGSVVLDFGDGKVGTATIVDGTFVAMKPAGIVEDHPLTCTVVVGDAQGRPLVSAFEVPVSR